MIEILKAPRRDKSKVRAKNRPQPKQSTWSVRASYEAGRAGRRLRIWNPGQVGPNAILDSIELIRDRSRDATQNNGWIKRGINTWVSNENGTGITPPSMAMDKTFALTANKLWNCWVKFADADPIVNFYGLCCPAAQPQAGRRLRFRFRR